MATTVALAGCHSMTAIAVVAGRAAIESAQARWRAVNAPHLVALVRAGARFENDQLVERPTNALPSAA